jgi:6-phosphogluconate dehydrogenase
MKIRLIGLGKMGFNLALNMKDNKFDVLAFDLNDTQKQLAKKEGIQVVDTLEALLEGKDQKVVFLMVPAGPITESVITQVKPFLQLGDIIIDAGNSNFNDSLRRYQTLKADGIDFVDCGTSGGTYGARHGACLMVGGESDVIKQVNHLFESIAIEGGYIHVGGPASGHYVKMVHNGIEYGMMQAIGEGYELLSKSGYDIDYEGLSAVWNHGSIIESALIGYIQNAFSKDAKLDEISGRVDDSGEGMWMIEEALKKKVSLPTITASLFTRFKSKDDDKFAERVVAAMRKEFGGHATYKK